MQKLSHVEAQRVIGVLGETLDRLSCMSCVPERPVEDASLLDGVSASVRSVLQCQFQLEEALMVEKEKRNNKDAAAHIERRLRANTRALCRALRDNPAAAASLRRLSSRTAGFGPADDETGEWKDGNADSDPNPDADANADADADVSGARARTRARGGVESTLAGLRDVVYRSLTTTVEDEATQKLQLESVRSREEEAEEDRKTLDIQLNIARRDRTRMVGELDSKVSKLGAELRDVRRTAEQEDELLESEMLRETTRLDEEHAKMCTQFSEEVGKASEELATRAAEMEAAELQLMKKQNKAEAELNGQVDKYDTDLLAKQRQLDDMRALHERESTRLAELEDHFVRVDAEIARIAKEEEEWARFVEEQATDEHAQHNGAAALQALFRGIQGRIAFEAHAKKSGKKKK